MKLNTMASLRAVLLGAALITTATLAPTALRADDRNYHDKGHNDDHRWDSHEDKAYRMYLKEHHRKYQNFDRLREDDRQAYWGWRHDHSDALLHITVR